MAAKTQHDYLIGSLGGGRTPRFRPVVWFEDDALGVNGGALAPHPFTPKSAFSWKGPLWGIGVQIEFHVRAAYGAALPVNALTLNDEFPTTIVDSIKVHGANSRLKVTDDFHLIPGSSLIRYLDMFKPFQPTSVLVSINGAPYVQQLDNGSAPVAKPTFVANTNTDYDVRINFVLPVVPAGIREWLAFCYDPQDWTDLKITLGIGDATALFDNTGQANPAVITFGARQGNNAVGGTAAPAGDGLIRFSLIEVSTEDEAGAPAQNRSLGVGSKLLYRSFQNILTAISQTVNQNVILAPLTTSELPYIRYILKMGNAPAVNPTNGVANVINNLNDAEINFAIPRRKNSDIRTYMDAFGPKDFHQAARGVTIPKGYLMEDFCVSGSLRDALDTHGLGQNDLTIRANVQQGTGALATQLMQLLEERVLTLAQ